VNKQSLTNPQASLVDALIDGIKQKVEQPADVSRSDSDLENDDDKNNNRKESEVVP
jgi:hypothetical protein